MAKGDDLIGRLVLGRYRIVRKLAQGGMGVVYLARAEGAAGFVKPVVVKRIIPSLVEDEKMAQMFVREARILSNLQHPGIVGVIDFAEEFDAYVMVLEYVHGYHLGRWARFMRERRGGFPAALALQIAIEVLTALHYAHTRTRADGTSLHIVHRDISPSNIFIDTEGHVHVLDFGIARMSGDADEYKTQEVTLKGKLAYLGPELLSGKAPTSLSDVYAVGVVLHELLLGRNEFRGREMSETVARVLATKPASVEAIRDDVPAGMDAILAQALAKSPENRYQSAAEFAQALRDVRLIPEERVVEMLATAVRRDFPEVPEHLGVEDLEDLEEAWRNPPEEILEASETEPVPITVLEPGPGPRASYAPTRAGSLRPGPTSIEPPREKSSWLRLFGLIAVIMSAAGGAAALAVYFQRPPAPGQPSVLIVDQRSVKEDRAEPAAIDAGDFDAPEPATVVRAKSPAERVTAAFARRSGALSRCFEAHEEQAPSEAVWVRFTLRASGAVSDVALEPKAIEKSPLGVCLLAAARKTHFPSLGRDLTARVPIHRR